MYFPNARKETGSEMGWYSDEIQSSCGMMDFKKENMIPDIDFTCAIRCFACRAVVHGGQRGNSTNSPKNAVIAE